MVSTELASILAKRLAVNSEETTEVENTNGVVPPPPPMVPEKIVENPYVEKGDVSIDDLIARALAKKEQNNNQNANQTPLKVTTKTEEAGSTYGSTVTSPTSSNDMRSPPPKTSIRELLEKELRHNNTNTPAVIKNPVVAIAHHRDRPASPCRRPPTSLESDELEKKLAAQRMKKIDVEAIEKKSDDSTDILSELEAKLAAQRSKAVDVVALEKSVCEEIYKSPPPPPKPARQLDDSRRDSLEANERLQAEVDDDKTFEEVEKKIDELTKSMEKTQESTTKTNNQGSLDASITIDDVFPVAPPTSTIPLAPILNDIDLPPPPTFSPPPIPTSMSPPRSPTVPPPPPPIAPEALTQDGPTLVSTMCQTPPLVLPKKISLVDSPLLKRRIPCLATPTPFIPTTELVEMVRKDDEFNGRSTPTLPEDVQSSSRPQSPAVPKKPSVVLSPLGLMCDTDLSSEKTPSSPSPIVPKKPVNSSTAEDPSLAEMLERRARILEGEVEPVKLTQRLPLYAEFPEFSRKQIQYFTETFKKFDEDHDNFIDFEELKRMMERLGEAQTHIALKQLIVKVDEDKDGKISQREFLLIFRLAVRGEISCSEVFTKLAESVDVTKEGVLGAASFFQAKIEELSKTSKFEEEIKEEQLERRKLEEEKKERKQKFLEKKNLFH